MGKGINLAYLDEKVAFFDNLDRNTFCNDMIDYMLGQLNYPPGDFDIVFWCPPGKTISEMVAIGFEVDCLKMAEASIISKMLVLFVKHVKTTEIKKLEDEEDDIAYRAVRELRAVILRPISKDKMRPMKSDSKKARDRKSVV